MENEAILKRLDNLERKVNGELTNDLFTRAEVEYMLENIFDDLTQDFDADDNLESVEFGINGNEIYISHCTLEIDNDIDDVIKNCLQSREQDA